MNKALANPLPTEQREIPSVMARQGKELNYLNSVIEDLEIRLLPILSPERPDAVDSVDGEKSAITDYGQKISDQAEETNRLADRIAGLIVRLEL